MGKVQGIIIAVAIIVLVAVTGMGIVAILNLIEYMQQRERDGKSWIDPEEKRKKAVKK